MSRFYGIYVKGKPNNILDLTKLSNFERTSNYKSEELYTLKDIIKLTTEYDDELDFKLALFYSNVIPLEDITKDIVVRSCGNSKDDKKIGKAMDIIYKPCIDLFRPSFIKELYLSKTNLPEDCEFLKNLLNEFRPYSSSMDTQRYTSEVYYDAIYNILINYEKGYFSKEELKKAMNNFLNHEIYYVIGESTPNGYDKSVQYQYRTDKKTGKKQIDILSLYKLVSFYINNSNDNRLVSGKADYKQLLGLKQEIEEDINKRELERLKCLKEALLLAEQDRLMFSEGEEEDNLDKPKTKKRNLSNEIIGQMKIEDI